jgi:hypothetical protein
MADFYEIDLLDVDAEKSGDAIAIRYELQGEQFIHVVDAGYQATGDLVARHVREFYGNPNFIDHVVVTHNDGDHAGGVRTVLQSFHIGTLWMLRPWIYAANLLPHFENYTSVDRLAARLKTLYPNLAALEQIAVQRGINIEEPWQGANIGAFTVLAPSPQSYLRYLLQSEKTPEVTPGITTLIEDFLREAAQKVVTLVKRGWGVEVFSTEETSAENEMSVVQYAELCGHKILLTGDAGRQAMREALTRARAIGIPLPGIDRFQVPHHASRRNVSTEILDGWLGPRLQHAFPPGQGTFTAMISSSKPDKDHPRKAVVRALMHRGARVYATEGTNYAFWRNAPNRGWGPITPLSYPDEIEE